MERRIRRCEETDRRPEHTAGAPDGSEGACRAASQYVHDHHAAGEQQDQRRSARGAGPDRLPPAARSGS